MFATVYRHSRVKDGRRVVARMYRGKYRLDPREKIKDVPLHTNDKQFAQQKLRKILEDEQNERAGFIRPKKQREAMAPAAVRAHRNVHCRAKTRSAEMKNMCANWKKKLLVLASEVRWKYIADITAESFCAWRREQNNLQNAERLSVCDWWVAELVGAGDRTNPLRFVERIQTAVEPTRQRRASSAADLQRLIAAAGRRGIVYLVAASTGIRRGELHRLEWRDVVLEMPQPFIFVRRSIAKNHTTTKQPLPDYVARELENFRPADFRQTNESSVTESLTWIHSEGTWRAPVFVTAMSKVDTRISTHFGQRFLLGWL